MSIADFEFDTPFTVDKNGQAEHAEGVRYVPHAECDADADITLDGVPYKSHPEWDALSGFTGQYGYNGPMMHPSEYVSGGLARWITETPGTYVYVEVGDGDGWAVLTLRH